MYMKCIILALSLFCIMMILWESKSGKKIGYSNNYLIEIQVFSTYFGSLTKNSNPQSYLKFYYFGKNITVCTNSLTWDNCWYISCLSFWVTWSRWLPD
jgi:hypothetical protein